MVRQYDSGVLEFSLYCPRARRVTVAGDFNRWNPLTTRMVPRGAGWWFRRMRLRAGVYEFRYWVDGDWIPDYAAFGLTLGPYGWNSVVCVEDGATARIGDRP